MKYILIMILVTLTLFGNQKLDVMISKDLPYVYADHMGTKIKIMRIQDTSHRISDDYTKTSRECPPFCIHPIKLDKVIKSVAELEVLDFIKHKKGLVVDARLKSWYELETIPTAINIPYIAVENASKEGRIKLFKALGAKDTANGKLDFSDAKKLLLFCNGPWCDQSPRFIRAVTKYGYPENKLFYYRDGFQAWKLLGLTTVVTKEKIKK